MSVEKMTNEQLIDMLERIDCTHAHAKEAARRLRGPDYKAEAMAMRKFIRGEGGWKDYVDSRTANEAKEKTDG